MIKGRVFPPDDALFGLARPRRFEKGQIVRQKNTVSPKMTIESIDPKSYKVTCVWFVHHKCRTKEFEENELEVCE